MHDRVYLVGIGAIILGSHRLLPCIWVDIVLQDAADSGASLPAKLGKKGLQPGCLIQLSPRSGPLRLPRLSVCGRQS
jgi:hypothetical protein